MKKYKNFYAAVKECNSVIITDLMSWMRRCAFDDVRYSRPNDDPDLPKPSSETVLAAKKRRDKEATEIGKRIIYQYGIMLSDYDEQFEDNGMKWLGELDVKYRLHNLARIDREIKRAIEKMEGTAFDAIENPELKQRLFNKYFVPQADRARLGMMCSKLVAYINLEEVNCEPITEPMKKNFEVFKKSYDRAMYARLMITDPLFTDHDIPLDRRAYTEITNAMTYCINQYLKVLSTNSMDEVWKWSGLIIESHLFGSVKRL